MRVNGTPAATRYSTSEHTCASSTLLPPQKDPLILDIGANIGTHSLWFASLGYRTHSFEPLRRNVALLHCSVTATPEVQRYIRINNFGRGNKDMEVCMVSEVNNMGGTHAEVLEQGSEYASWRQQAQAVCTREHRLRADPGLVLGECAELAASVPAQGRCGGL